MHVLIQMILMTQINKNEYITMDNFIIWVRELMSKNDKAHNVDHIERVLEFARNICKDKENMRLVTIGVWCHEMLDKKLESNFGSEELLRKTLKEYLSGEDLEVGIECAVNVGWSKRFNKKNIKHKYIVNCVSKADMLDGLCSPFDNLVNGDRKSCTGYKRCKVYGKVINGTKKDKSHTEIMNHYDEKLSKMFEYFDDEYSKYICEKAMKWWESIR